MVYIIPVSLNLKRSGAGEGGGLGGGGHICANDPGMQRLERQNTCQQTKALKVVY